MASDDGLSMASDDDDGLTREELLALVADMREDWETFNRILNTQATAFGWCGEYEDRMMQYNKETKVLKMCGRHPDGRIISTRNAYAARRMSMGHVMTTCQRLGVDLPNLTVAGVVADHKALDDAHDQLKHHVDNQ